MKEDTPLTQAIEKTDLIYGINDRPPLKEAVFAAFQHLLAVFVAIVTPPLIIASALGLNPIVTSYLVSMSLLASGISTYIQCRKIGPVGCGLLCVQGTSFSFIGAITSNFAGAGIHALPIIFGVTIAGSSIEMIVSRILKYTQKIITPLISGIVVTLIGLSLVKVGIVACAGGHNAGANFGSLQNIGIAVLVIVTIVILNSNRNKYIRMSSIIIGIILGYMVSYFLNMVDFSSLAGISGVNVPIPFKYGIGFSWSAFIAMGLVYFITSIEALGDITANSMIGGEPISGEKYIKRVQGGVLGDGVSSLLAGVINSFPTSIFAQNNGLIQMTGVASRYVGYYIAGFLVILSVFPFIGGVFSVMPEPVLGGATLLMFGTVAASGIKIISSQVIDRKAVLILAISFAFGLGVELAPEVLVQMPKWAQGIFSSGITTGGLAAIISSLVLNLRKAK